MGKPSLSVAIRIPRHRQTLSDQLVLGAVTGGLFGPGVLVEGREAGAIRFGSDGGAWWSGLQRGEVVLTGEGGETLVECRVWCRRLALRSVLLAACLGALVATVAFVGLGWLASWSVPLGIAVAVLYEEATWHVRRRRLAIRIRAFLHNTTYLTSM